MPTIKTEKKDDDIVVMDISSGSENHTIVRDEVTSADVAMDQSMDKSDSDKKLFVDEDIEDEIVREIPVFLSPELSDKIQLIQFPLQQQQHSMEPEAVRVKPRHCMMEIDIPTPSNIQFQGLYHMPSRTFSSQTIPVSTHMALGKMIEVGGSDGEPKTMGLHLVPLSRMTQMRPSFSHIDEAALASSSTTEDELRKQQQQDAAGPGANERKAITFRKKESERQELARKSSYGYKKASEDAEGWHSLEVYDDSSLQANLLMEKVACPVEHQGRNLLDVESLEKEQRSSTNNKIPGTSLNALYLNTLNYLPPRDDLADDTDVTTFGKSDGGAEDDDRGQLELVVRKLVKLMRLGRPIPFSLLRAEFPRPSASESRSTGISDTTLTVALGSCAVLVRGNWCLNSKLLSYPPAMTQARTFLLCLFQSMRTVHRERLVQVFASEEDLRKTSPDDDEEDDKVTPEVIEFLLEQLGEKTKEGWVLKVDDDTKFAEQHPQTTLVHLQYWAKQIDLFRPMIERYRA